VVSRRRGDSLRRRGGEALRERRCRRLRDEEHGDASFVSARRGVA
jgi:hypothetical protein